LARTVALVAKIWAGVCFAGGMWLTFTLDSAPRHPDQYSGRTQLFAWNSKSVYLTPSEHSAVSLLNSSSLVLFALGVMIALCLLALVLHAASVHGRRRRDGGSIVT
jgi:hypothetical protein